MDLPALWFMGDDPKTLYRFGRMLLKDATLGMCNSREFLLAEYDLQNSMRAFSEDVPLPKGFVTPRLSLPDRSFAPDFFSFSSYDFVSRRLRDAMAQPDHVVQFVPIELIRGGPEACAQDYQLMRVLAQQSAMDLARSECELEQWTNWVVGKQEQRPQAIHRFVLLDDMRPQTDIFRLAESPSYIMTVDALAERVLRAGCTGVEFSDPTTSFGGKYVQRLRTATGLAERRVGYLD